MRRKLSVARALVLGLIVGHVVWIYSSVSLAYQHREILVLSTVDPKSKNPDQLASLVDFVAWKTKSASIQNIALYQNQDYDISISGRLAKVPGYLVWSGFFDVVGAAPMLGRLFLPEEMSAHQNDVAILTNGLWKKSFGADPAVVGRTIIVDNEKYIVIGVMAESFDRMGAGQIIFPFRPQAFEGSGHDRVFRVIATLKPGTEPSQFQAQINSVQAMRDREEGNKHPIFKAQIAPLSSL